MTRFNEHLDANCSLCRTAVQHGRTIYIQHIAMDNRTICRGCYNRMTALFEVAPPASRDAKQVELEVSKSKLQEQLNDVQKQLDELGGRG